MLIDRQAKVFVSKIFGDVRVNKKTIQKVYIVPKLGSQDKTKAPFKTSTSSPNTMTTYGINLDIAKR